MFVGLPSAITAIIIVCWVALSNHSAKRLHQRLAAAMVRDGNRTLLLIVARVFRLPPMIMMSRLPTTTL